MTDAPATVPTLVDSNILIDVLSGDSTWSAWSAARLAESSTLVINPIIFGEVSAGFIRLEDVDQAFPAERFVRATLPYEAAFLAASRHRDYRQRGGSARIPLPDFFIGAHAEVLGLRLLTRDQTRYRTYFPTVELVTPP